MLGCGRGKPGPPPIDTELISRVVADLSLAQALIAQVPILVRDSMQSVYHDSVLADYGLTRSEFDSIMWIVRREPLWIDSVYTRAGDIVSRELAEE